MKTTQQQFKQFEKRFPQIAAQSKLTPEQRLKQYENSKRIVTQIEDPIRLAAIRAALTKLKSKNQKYLQHLQLNKSWRKIYNGLLTYNEQQQLPKLINLKLCQASGPQKSFFDPFAKTPISICYNKINKYDAFEKQVLFNLILHYDNKVKSQTNWNLIEPTIKSTVRALHISGLCQKDDKPCFEDEINRRVVSKQRFQGVKFDFDELYRKGIEDYEPISQVMFN